MRSKFPGTMLSIWARGALTFALMISLLAAATGADPLQEAMALEKQGKLKEARQLYHSAAKEFRRVGDQHNLATALSEAAYVSVSLGDYAVAMTEAEEAVKLRQALHEDAKLGTDLNTIGPCPGPMWRPPRSTAARPGW